MDRLRSPEGCPWDREQTFDTIKPYLLEGVPRSLPALMEARQIAGRAAGAGFDWKNVDEVLEKLREELAELEMARQAGSQDALQDEIGDLLFVIVNIARFLKVDPEQA